MALELHEFFRKYASVPLKLRFVPIDFSKGGNTTLRDVYHEVKKLEDEMLPLKIREQELLDLAEPVLKRL